MPPRRGGGQETVIRNVASQHHEIARVLGVLPKLDAGARNHVWEQVVGDDGFKDHAGRQVGGDGRADGREAGGVFFGAEGAGACGDGGLQGFEGRRYGRR